MTRCAVYPRVCGGTLKNHAPNPFYLGLSPRVRGNLRGLLDYLGHSGSIPACAGEPVRAGAVRRHPTVYPRVCGGTCRDGRDNRCELGLSPRVRGNPNQSVTDLVAVRSIPACAGEPALPRYRPRCHRVYPRVCGGTFHECTDVRQSNGLSPRVRGNPQKPRSQPILFGSIPACAGEPVRAGAVRRHPTVYPRVCGGTCRDGRDNRCELGLSPRVRGNHVETAVTADGPGSIPACAGEPKSLGCTKCGGRVYPRVCGGTTLRGCGSR